VYSIDYEPWDKYDGEIGSEQTPDDMDESQFIGARMKFQYLMPKSVFVKENMAYEDIELTTYNDFFFSLKKEISNPDVPYGKTFRSLSQIVIRNAGVNSCHMIWSCEAKFPNGPPMVGRQIQSAMRAGTTDTSVLVGENICKYADIYN